MPMKSPRESNRMKETAERNKSLVSALREGDTRKAKTLLEAGADPCADTGGGRTPLMHAVVGGHVRSIKVVLGRVDKAEVNRKEEACGMTALMVAANVGHRGAADLLLKAGADVNTADVVSGHTAMMLAARRGYTAVVRRLLRSHATMGLCNAEKKTAIMLAIEGGHSQAADVLYKAGDTAGPYPCTAGHKTIAVETKDPPRTAEEWTTTLLYGLDFFNHPGRKSVNSERILTGVVNSCLGGSADPNAHDTGHKTALMVAAGCAMKGSIKLLLAAGAKVDARDDNGRTALIAAAQAGHAEVIKDLLYAGAEPSVADNDGKTAGMWALENDHEQACRQLSQAGTVEIETAADVDVEDCGPGR